MSGIYEKPQSVTCSEILKSRQMLSPFEDFMKRTMSVLQGVWSKLNYIREIRSPDGNYEHWGLAKMYGQSAIQQMIGDVHTELYLQLLRTPLPELLQQLELSADDAECSARQLAEQLHQNRQQITPKNLCGGAPEHLKSVLLVADLVSKRTERQRR